jgi:hypothetical protein
MSNARAAPTSNFNRMTRMAADAGGKRPRGVEAAHGRAARGRRRDPGGPAVATGDSGAPGAGRRGRDAHARRGLRPRRHRPGADPHLAARRPAEAPGPAPGARAARRVRPGAQPISRYLGYRRATENTKTAVTAPARPMVRGAPISSASAPTGTTLT